MRLATIRVGETVTARIEGVGETVNKVVTEVAP